MRRTRRPVVATCMGVVFDQNGRITASSTPAWVPAAILASLTAIAPVNWTNIVAPRLGIFARPTVQSRGNAPWYWYLSSADQRLFDEQWPPVVDWYHCTIRQFAAGNPLKPLILPDAPHYVYLNNEADAVRSMRTFLGLPLGKN